MDKSSQEIYGPTATEELQRFGCSRHVDMGTFGFDDETIPEDQRPAKPQQRGSRLPAPVAFDATLRPNDPVLMGGLLEVSGFPWGNLRKTYREETRQALCLFMLHLWVAARQHGDALLSIPKDKNHYGKGKTCFGYAAFSRAFDHMTVSVRRYCPACYRDCPIVSALDSGHCEAVYVRSKETVLVG